MEHEEADDIDDEDEDDDEYISLLWMFSLETLTPVEFAFWWDMSEMCFKIEVNVDGEAEWFWIADIVASM